LELAVKSVENLVRLGANLTSSNFNNYGLRHCDNNVGGCAESQLPIKSSCPYRVLDVQSDASPRAIKASYRTLVKRWHPDHYRPGSDAYTESSLMTKLLNESYARIKNAPLQIRNGVAAALSSEASPNSGRDTSGEPDPSGSSHSEYVPRDPNSRAAEYYRMVERARQAGARDDATRPFDWFGFVVRFVFGALFGAVLSFRVMIDLYRWQESPTFIYIAVVATVLFCALASGLGGDAFWRANPPRRSIAVAQLTNRKGKWAQYKRRKHWAYFVILGWIPIGWLFDIFTVKVFHTEKPARLLWIFWSLPWIVAWHRHLFAVDSVAEMPCTMRLIEVPSLHG
jgi:hypothetical protein